MREAVMFGVPEESQRRSFPTYKGAGTVEVLGGAVYLEGTVYGLSRWWMIPVAVVLLLAGTFLELKVARGGIWVGLGAAAAVALYDMVASRRGWALRMQVPRQAGLVMDTDGEDAHVSLQVDVVVSSPRRPPLVGFTCSTATARAVVAALGA